MYRQLFSLIFVATFFTSNFAVKANEPYLFGFGGFSWVEDHDPVIPNGGGFSVSTWETV